MSRYKSQTESVLAAYRAQHPFIADIEPDVLAAFDAIHGSYQRGGKLLLCGNGGSNADCEHIVGELGKKFLLDRPIDPAFRDALLQYGELGAHLAGELHSALRAINLSSHTSLLTATINDNSADMAYAQQLCVFGDPGDALLAISTSGNSRNVRAAAVAAKAMGVATVAFTGAHGGELAEFCDLAIRVPETSVPFIQEKQEAVYHLLCAMLEAERWG